MAGATAAVDFIAGLAPGPGDRRSRLRVAHEVIDAHELRLRRRVEDALAGFGDRVTVFSRAADRTPTLLLGFPGADSMDAYRHLARSAVAAPAGTFYAYEPARALGIDAALRIGLAPYNDDDEVDRLLAGLADLLR
ncbi:aminotransferase class V-fold PLP-dependent enzyme [Micropruina sonneratiae]|uniref:aminotransferase class V-fold PLP-dependent enzyme n=1 Tax=Micropruina sonneratiae TaxID=2986940 RepID=UPI0022263CC6|nr:aminotransferase class V-fold PLP-dependent enzyme [Micropruina sp. KQZ13P-5]MCW3158290.1 aminotransferase class V-fold PLP-dependent enzyme [Micropruina sp. KQZ13P-5]